MLSKVFSHLAYTPYLAPSDFHFFPNLKQRLDGEKLTSDDKVKAAVDWYLQILDECYCALGIEKRIVRYNKSLNSFGDFTDK